MYTVRVDGRAPLEEGPQGEGQASQDLGKEENTGFY